MNSTHRACLLFSLCWPLRCFKDVKTDAHFSNRSGYMVSTYYAIDFRGASERPTCSSLGQTKETHQYAKSYSCRSHDGLS